MINVSLKKDDLAKISYACLSGATVTVILSHWISYKILRAIYLNGGLPQNTNKEIVPLS
jgi:hypothetical protein